MNSLLLWIGGLLCAVLGLMFAAPYVIDWNAYRGVFEEEASRILGRDVRVGGQVNLRLLPSPYVRFEKVRISDAGAALGEPFFRAEAFTLWLSPTPLLKGAIEASEVEFDRPVLRLAVDAEGRGNWQAIKVAPGSLPFVPSDVVLQQVRIRNGLISLRTPSSPEPLTLSGIDGEVAAASLDGPYRFRGLVDWYGSRRELRIGTGQREPDGKLRYKASVRSTDNGNLYSLDGVLSEISARARHTGTLTARLPLATVIGGVFGAGGQAQGGRGSDSIDLKANLEGDLDGAKLTDMSFAFEQDGKPQLMNGELVAGWRNGLRVETRLSSRWLDLDLFTRPEGRKAPPADTLRRLIGQLSSLLARDGTSLLTIDVDQINLGGEAMSGVRLALARAGGLTSIGELRANLPGNARAELRGTLGAPTSAVSQGPATASAPFDAFEGEILLRGTSHQRFASWAGAGAMLATSTPSDPTALPDLPFSIASRLRLLPEAVVLNNAQVELGDWQVRAEAGWKWGNEASLEITAEGRSIDIGTFAPRTLGLVPSAARQGEASPGQRFAESGSSILVRLVDRVAAIEQTVGSLKLNLRAGELSDGLTVLRDVDAEVAIKGGTLLLTRFRATTAVGARMELLGDLRDLRSKPTGTMRGWASAGSAEAVSSLLEALPTGARAVAGTWLAPSRTADLGFAVTLGGSGSSDQVTLNGDGVIDSARVAMSVKLDGGLAQWREAPITFFLDIDEPMPGALLRRLASQRVAATSVAQSTEHAALTVRASGANARSIITTGRLDTRGGTAPLSVSFNGSSALNAENGVDLAGELAVQAPAAADLMVLAGAVRKPQLADIGIRGAIGLQRKPGSITLVASGLAIGGSRVGGRLALTDKGERRRIDGLITTDVISVTGMLGLLLDGAAKPSLEDDAAQPGGSGASPWPSAPFALALLDGVEGQLVVTAPAATLSPGLVLADAEARIAFTPGRVELQSLGGVALAGRFTARGTIETAAAGANIAFEGRMTGAQLERLVGGGVDGQLAAGEANASWSVSARGLSPRAAMSAMAGKGEIELRNGRVQGVAATLVEKAAQAALDSNDPVDRAALERIVGSERRRSHTQIGNRKLSIDISEGAARIAPLEIVSAEANVKNTTTIDLAQLKVDSEWQVSPRRALPSAERGQGPRRDPLPPISIVWTGPLGGLAQADPRVSVDQLDRELAIRRMEREAERLEQLRRQDDERIREIERQKRMEVPDRGQDSALPGSAPVIQAPFPVPTQVAPVQAPSGSAAPAPPPRVVRPPASPRQGQTKTLQELLMGQQ